LGKKARAEKAHSYC